MKRKNRARRERKRLNKVVNSVMDEMITDGYFEELPGGYIRLTPKGVDFKQRHRADSELIMTVSNAVREQQAREADLAIKSAILKTTRRIVG